jgi:hypothetical protein
MRWVRREDSDLSPEADRVRLSRADQYRCPSIVVEQFDTADAVVRAARMHGAVSYLEGDEALVVDFQDSHARRVGPELYTEAALRRSLAGRDVLS